MSGLFLSYSRTDRDLAHEILLGMRDLGVEVWWDEEMPGVDWQRELERRINALAAVIVLWTPASMNSENVRDEARLGQRMGKLANVLVSVSAPPFPFDRVNGLPLDGWIRNQPHGGWARPRTLHRVQSLRGAFRTQRLSARFRQSCARQPA